MTRPRVRDDFLLVALAHADAAREELGLVRPGEIVFEFAE